MFIDNEWADLLAARATLRVSDFRRRDLEPDRISLSYVVHCLLQGKNLESDSAKKGMVYEFPDDIEFSEPLIKALQTGEIEARGTFSRVRLDYPIFEKGDSNVQLSLLSADYRSRHDVIIGIGEEAAPSDIPRSLWSYEGAIWEKSILWVVDPKALEESRGRGLKIERTAPFPPERPFDFVELTCFDGVTLNLSEALGWANGQALRGAKKPTKNDRNAGVKAKEDWKVIEKWLEKKIESGQIWNNWDDVWYSLQHLLKTAKSTKTPAQPYKPLEKRLRDHNTKLLVALRRQIKTSRTKK